MSFAAQNQDRLETLACFLAPVAIAGVLALAGSPPAPEVEPPRVSEAAEDESRPVQVTDRAPVQGGERSAFDAEIGRLLAAEEIASVFPHSDSEPEIVDEPAAPIETSRPEFSLTSVMSGRSGAMCVINQKVHQVGAEVAPGWRVATISAEARSVTLEGPDGETVTLTQGF
jgi:hypothetical protein